MAPSWCGCRSWRWWRRCSTSAATTGPTRLGAWPPRPSRVGVAGASPHESPARPAGAGDGGDRRWAAVEDARRRPRPPGGAGPGPLAGGPLPGIDTPDPELLVDRRDTLPVRRREQGRHHLTLLVADGDGFRNLSRMLSLANLAAPRKGRGAASWELLAEHAQGLIAL